MFSEIHFFEAGFIKKSSWKDKNPESEPTRRVLAGFVRAGDSNVPI
jgi:hypothetical protein